MRVVLNALRSIVFIFWMMVTVVPWGLTMVLMSIVVRGQPLFRVAAGWLSVAIFGARWICGIRYRIQGWEHIEQADREGRKIILCSKHQSTWETFFYPTVMPRSLSYVFKRELIYVPFFGWAMARMDMIHIDRSKGASAWKRIARQGRQFLDEGNWVIMFPEGTRSARGEVGDYKSGAASLAISTGAAIVPIAVNSAICWPKTSFIKRPGLIDVVIGPPIAPQGHKPDSLNAAVRDWIEAEMRRIDAPAYRQPADAGQARATEAA